MRIVAGTHRGRHIVAPKGHSTRPTADRVRQALFNVLEHAPWSPSLAGSRVIDLFAGSGALGLEALSRGAEFCLLADDDPAAVAAIQANLDTLGLADRGEARRWDATRLIPRQDSPRASGLAGPRGAFDLAFLDPPYAKGLTDPALAVLNEGGWLSRHAVAIVERGAGEPEPSAPGFAVIDSRAWGAARVWFLRLEA
jgi:16S rRNA (guanine966-N2)-methyltransferase